MERNTSARLERNIRERERRLKMKNLYSRLASVIHPQQPLKLSVPELIDKATSYVNHLHERIESLRQQKEIYEGIFDVDKPESGARRPSPQRPILDIQSWGSSSMEVNLICSSDNKSLVFECFRIFQEEGAEVINFTSNKIGDNIIYIIRAQAIVVRIGIDTSRIHQRLKQMIH